MRTDYGVFFLACIVVLIILTFFCLIRAVIGPRLTDRIVAGNMIGTMTIAIIALLSVYLGENAILDICLLFAAMSFIAVIVLTKIYHGIYSSLAAAGEVSKWRENEHFNHKDDTGCGTDCCGGTDYGDTGQGRI